jgi:hypothetical protein
MPVRADLYFILNFAQYSPPNEINEFWRLNSRQRLNFPYEGIGDFLSHSRHLRTGFSNIVSCKIETHGNINSYIRIFIIQRDYKGQVGRTVF